MPKQDEPKLLLKIRAAIRYAKKKPRFVGRFYDSSHQKGEPAAIFIDGNQLTVISYCGSDILETIRNKLATERGFEVSKTTELLGTTTGFTMLITFT